MEKPENVPRSISLKDLLDIPAIQDLTNSFSELTGLAAAILDRSGEVLIASHWQKICTDFHRKHPDTAAKCRESDTVLAEKAGKGLRYNIYRCKNGLVDVASPIIIDDMHIGNLFVGQFFLESPDLELFTRQAETHGFDREEYLDTLNQVPVLTSERIQQVMAFFSDLTAVIATSGNDRKKLFELNQDLQERVENRTAKLKAEIRHRMQIEVKLQRRVEFEQLAAGISSEFAGSNDSRIEKTITLTLKRVGIFTNADRAYLFQFKDDGLHADNTHEWCADDIEPQSERLKSLAIDRELPWFAGIIRKRETIHVPDVAALPPEARLERSHFEARSIRSLIVVPLQTAGELRGFLGFDTVREPRTWSEDDQKVLRFISETIGTAIDRHRAEAEQTRLISELKEALARVKQLSGLLPICSFCKKIRDDKGYWNRIETYIMEHSEADFSHSICQECAKKYYPDFL